MNDENNPVSMGQEPISTVWPPPPTHQAVDIDPSPLNNLDAFRVQSVFLVILFSFLSLGIYPAVWLSQQAERIRRVMPAMAVPSGFVITALGLAIVSAAVDVADWFISNASFDAFSNILDKIYLVVLLVLTFGVRNRLNSVLETRRGDPHWFSGGWTFWFGVAYLQYKINKNIQRGQQQ